MLLLLVEGQVRLETSASRVQHPTSSPSAALTPHLLSLATGHAGTVVGILAPGPSAKPFVASDQSTDAMAVDDPSASTGSTSTSTAPAQSESAKKKEEEARAEREKKYPPPHRTGLVLAAEKKVTSKLLEKDQGSSEKLFLVNGCVLSFVRSASGTVQAC